ncbi:MAG: YrhA family protein [Alphaproteobacteria bacterium]
MAKIKNQTGAIVASKALDDELETCMENLFNNDFPLLPDDYIKFLKMADGFLWNGMEIFGTANINAEEYTAPNIVSANQNYDEKYPKLIGKLVVGKMDNDLFAYDYTTRKYQVIDTVDCEALQDFASIEELVLSIMK